MPFVAGLAPLPVTPPDGDEPHVRISSDDLAVLDSLENSEQHAHPKSDSWRRRDAPLDPLLYAAAVASGPHVTKHHYHHDFFPMEQDEVRDWSQWHAEQEQVSPAYVSRQAPRSQRLKESAQRQQEALPEPLPSTVNANPPPFNLPDPAAQVQCLSRARIPTPHGSAFLHLYRNNLDTKEHLAIVVDPAQEIRSRSLDAVWSPTESEMDRIVRGAHLGTPSPTSSRTPAPLVRIHSECFTGETIGSMRCDCGEQLDEALRLITLSGRGAVVYLRQEGRGIGLLEKLRAYNLQDLGHDTVTANLLLGHRADERGYALAGAILRDLGLPDVRLLTNNPSKVEALQAENVHIRERVPMVPRAWQDRPEQRMPGATLIGGGAAHGADLEKYMRTKVDRMGHMLTLPLHTV